MGFVSTYTNQTSEGELTKHSVLRAPGKGGRSYKSISYIFSIGLKDKPLRLNYSLCFFVSKTLFCLVPGMFPLQRETIFLGYYKELSQQGKPDSVAL